MADSIKLERRLLDRLRSSESQTQPLANGGVAAGQGVNRRMDIYRACQPPRGEGQEIVYAVNILAEFGLGSFPF